MKGNTVEDSSKSPESTRIDQKAFDDLKHKLSEEFRNASIKPKGEPSTSSVIPSDKAEDSIQVNSKIDIPAALVPGAKAPSANIVETPPRSGNTADQPIARTDSRETAEHNGAVMFAEGLFHGAIENPYNGAIQVIDHMGANLPELHLVDENALNDSTMAKLGTVAGTTLDFFALTAATGGFGSALRMGATAAGYAGILQPSDPQSSSSAFAQDRLKQAAVAGVSGLGMGLQALRLSSLGDFAVSEARSFGQSLTYGGLIGAVGGVVHAEADAIINKEHLLPTAQALGEDLLGGAALGAAWGSLGYMSVKANIKTIDTGDSRLRVHLGKDGQPVQVELRSNSDSASYNTAQINAVKMTNGSWKSNGFTARGAWLGVPQSRPEAAILNASMNPSGGVKISLNKLIQDGLGPVSAGQLNRTFLQGQADPKFWTELAAREPGQRFADWASPFTTILSAAALGML